MSTDARQLYVDAIKAYQTELGWTVVDGRTSSLKGLVAVFLARIGIMDADTFLNDFATTFHLPGHGIVCFLPWFPDRADIDEVPRSPRVCHQRLKTLAHEAQHGFQIKEEGWLRFSANYLLRSAKRAAYETEAYRVQVLLERYWDPTTGEVQRPREEPVASKPVMLNYCRSIVEHSLSQYQLSSTQLARAESMLMHHATRQPKWGRWRSWNIASLRTLRILLNAR